MNTIRGKEIIKLKNNCIPKELVSLGKLFCNNDVAKNPKFIPDGNKVQYCNIGMEKKPKMVKLSKSMSLEEKSKYVGLMNEFSDVFSSSYEELKEYDISIIQHTIPVKPNENTFKEKLRRINPMLIPLIEKNVERISLCKDYCFFRYF